MALQLLAYKRLLFYLGQELPVGKAGCLYFCSLNTTLTSVEEAEHGGGGGSAVSAEHISAAHDLGSHTLLPTSFLSPSLSPRGNDHSENEEVLWKRPLPKFNFKLLHSCDWRESP